jgi:nucleoside-diphosphate-sugar epimerase
LATYHLEQLLLRCSRPGRLAAYVVCPEVLYGAGEDDSQLHSVWRAAWEGQRLLQLHGQGRNRLPTLHVQDLAAFADAVVLQQLVARYLLACDDGAVSQAELLAAVGQLLGNKQTQ